jgi:hypothetical protein
LLALETVGKIENIEKLNVECDKEFECDKWKQSVYGAARSRNGRAYEILIST